MVRIIVNKGECAGMFDATGTSVPNAEGALSARAVSCVLVRADARRNLNTYMNMYVQFRTLRDALFVHPVEIVREIQVAAQFLILSSSITLKSMESQRKTSRWARIPDAAGTAAKNCQKPPAMHVATAPPT